MKLLTKYSWILEEAAYLTMLALPPAIACLTETLQMKMSNIFIGRTSGNNVKKMLSALFVGQTVNLCTLYPISEGLSVYVNILCSQAYGGKQYKLVGLYFYRALFMAALLFFPICTLLISVRPIVYSITQDWELAYHAGSYTTILCFGYPAYVYFKVVLSFLQAQNIVWPPLLYLILGNLLNGVLLFVFIIYYNAGIAGAATGYVISIYFIALLFYSHLKFTRVHTVTYINWTVSMISEWCHSAKYTLFPITNVIFGESSASIFPLLLLGLIFHNTTQLAIYTVQYSLWLLFALWTMGFSSGITVRVGNLLGANEYKKAFRAAIFSVFYGEMTILVPSILLFLISDPLSHLFTTDIEFARILSFNIKGMIFILLTDYQYFSQGILNGCCMQVTQSIVKFISRTLIGLTLAVIITNFVKWKALGFLLATGIGSTFSFVIGMIIILCRNWKDIALNVSKNTHTTSLHMEDKFSKKICGCIEVCKSSKLCESTIWESKTFLLCRYCLGILLGAILFVSVAIYCFSY